MTNYRKAHDQVGRDFITVNKKEVLNMCTIIAEKEVVRYFYNLRCEADGLELLK